MAPPEPYHGPISMAGSRYAPAHRKAEVAAILAAKPELKAQMEAKNTLATREQIAAADKADHFQNVGVQLAQAQSEALDEEIKQHTITVAHSVSTTVVNSRQIVTLIREAIKKESPGSAEASLKAVNDLWEQLEKLAATTYEAKNALPRYLEKQKENISLIAVSKVQQAYLETQQELDQQHKKVNIQHDVILAQQQAFKDHEVNTNGKLKEITELQERISRFSLEKGALLTELNKVKDQLVKSQTAEEAAIKNAAELKKEVAVITDSKKSLFTESIDLRNTIKDVEAKLKEAEQKATENYEKEIRRVTEELKKEQEKALALDTHVKALRINDTETRKEVEKTKAELKLLSEKYKNQSGEYAKVSENLKEQTKKATALNSDLLNLQKEKAELEKDCSRLTDTMNNLQKQHDELHSELEQARKDGVIAKEKAEELAKKLKQVTKENEGLVTDNADLHAKQTEHRVSLAKVHDENATLQAELKNKAIVSDDSADVATLKRELGDLQKVYAKSEEERIGWEKIGRDSMKQFKDLLPAYKNAENAKQMCKELQEENERLKAQIPTNAQTHGSSNGVGSGVSGDAVYWKKKYNDLLASME
ncbi:hypothetical protein N0V90_001155 [Kalmusia sp. IMI 367209]|nr:hypothetical protein N0V90_001155 [Kalmusia sp. IMI 367209]